MVKIHLDFDRLKKAIIKWGYICNNDCIFCHSAEYRREPPLSFDNIKKKINSAKRLGCKMVLFSGGEPLLIDRLPDIIKYSFSLGMYAGLITNGRILSRDDLLIELYKAGLRYVYMSFVSLNRDRYRIITGRDGLQESLKAIKNIIQLPSIMFTINIPIIKQNIDEVVNILRKITMIGVRRIKLSVIEPKGAALSNYNEVVPPLSATACVIRSIIDNIKKFGKEIKIYHDGLPYCLSPDYKRYNRDLYSENIIYMSESFEKRFYKVDYKNMDYVNGVCDLCTKKGECKGIYKGYIEASDIPLIPVKKEAKKKVENCLPVELKTDRNYEVNIGKLCNNSCIFCANGVVSKEENRFVEYEKIISEIERAYRDGFRSLGFLGGEITIHPDVIRIISYAKKTGFKRIAICTNGRRLSDINLAREMVRAGANRFMISIHSHREEIENYLNGRKNAFREKIEGIKNLIMIDRKEKRIEYGISLNACIHNLNYRELNEFITYFKGLGVSDFRFNFIRPENRAEYDKKIIPKMSDVKEYIERLILFNERYAKVNIAIGDIPFCLLPQMLLKNRTLLQRYIGEFRDLDTFVTTFMSRTDPNFIDRFSWRQRKVNDLKAKTPICDNCVFNSLCEGLFKKYVNIYGIKELGPIKSLPF